MFEKLFQYWFRFCSDFLRLRGFWFNAAVYIPHQLWGIEVHFKYGSWEARCQAYEDDRLKLRRDAARDAGLL